MDVDVIEGPLDNMNQATFRVKGNSVEGDASLFEKAAKWCREHSDHTVLQVAFIAEIKPDMTTLVLWSED